MRELLFTLKEFERRCKITRFIRRKMYQTAGTLKINDTDEYQNARLSIEDDLMISFETKGKKREVVYYPWEKISSIAYV